MRRFALATSAALLVAFPSPAAAAVVRSGTLEAERAVARTCDERVGASAPGAAASSWTAPAGGFLTARLDGDRSSDWDLAVIDEASGELIGASAAFGSTEQVLGYVTAGQRVTLRGCRRLGAAASVRFSLDLYEKPLPTAPEEQITMVEVPLGGLADLARLEATGLDVTHDAGPFSAKVVLYSGAERRRLTGAGFQAVTVIPDLAAHDRASRRAEARAPGPRVLPSGRTTYREYVDYQNELKGLAEHNPSLVRKVTLPLPSLEGRPIEGVEIATDVNRSDDGRPAYVLMGLHHAREWPSGELAMEFALDAVASHGGDARITAMLDKVRLFVLPVINPDGFVVSRAAGPSPDDDNPNATNALAVSDAMAYKRKNCRPTVPAQAAQPCATRTHSGVDLNRNYGAYWGGSGSSDLPTDQDYRGPAPYSEPESEAVHRFSSGLQDTVFISNHTFTADGKWLRQPGFDDVIQVTPDEAAMKDLGDAMAAATGWTSELGYKTLGDITGATEDWNYFAQGTYGYTPEIRGLNFHANYQDSVIGEYEGEDAQAGRGAREAFIVAGEWAANRADHGVIRGTAPAGRLLRLRKSFTTPTSQEGIVVNDVLDTTMTVPASGQFVWDVNPSTRPLSPSRSEAWTLTCESPPGTVLESRSIVVGRGEEVTPNLTCAFPAGVPPRRRRTRLRLLVRRSRSARTPNRRRHLRVTVVAEGGRVRNVRLRLSRRGRTYARARLRSLAGRRRVRVRRIRRIVPGRYRLAATGRDTAGRLLRAAVTVRYRR
ncbi:MAG TPA: M14 family zinc carboxypeptidase [Thermoleophilaceae bacterium]|nr:M14 family zinc carboxypeptidase [Thermoleophilaceae bacterium]